MCFSCFLNIFSVFVWVFLAYIVFQLHDVSLFVLKSIPFSPVLNLKTFVIRFSSHVEIFSTIKVKQSPTLKLSQKGKMINYQHYKCWTWLHPVSLPSILSTFLILIYYYDNYKYYCCCSLNLHRISKVALVKIVNKNDWTFLFTVNTYVFTHTVQHQHILRTLFELVAVFLFLLS